MKELRRYASLALAQSGARHLISNGILAGVEEVSARHEYYPGLATSSSGRFRVMLIEERRGAEAARLLDEHDAEPVELPDNWESQADVDLSGIDPRFLPDCPRCGLALTPDGARRDRCLTCGEAVDAQSLIVRAHGPEALEGVEALPARDDGWIDEELLVGYELACHRCGYPLGGLSVEGACPECGEAYDKHELIERLLDPSKRTTGA